MPSIDLHRRVHAPVDVVWDVLTDHRGYVNWAGVSKSALERQGSPDPNGVGAVRYLRKGPAAVREEVVASDAPRTFSYTVLSGPPVRDYLAKVTLTADGQSTLVDWTVRFEPKIPFSGLVIVPVVRKVITDLLAAATRESERRVKR